MCAVLSWNPLKNSCVEYGNIFVVARTVSKMWGGQKGPTSKILNFYDMRGPNSVNDQVIDRYMLKRGSRFIQQIKKNVMLYVRQQLHFFVFSYICRSWFVMLQCLMSPFFPVCMLLTLENIFLEFIQMEKIFPNMNPPAK